MRGLRILWVTGFCLLLVNDADASQSAQPDQFRFKHLTIDDGLSQNLVYSITQDHKGFLWFGTQDGLNRYDGYRFTIFRHNPFDSTTISGHEVRALLHDKNGNLWAATTGLDRFDYQTETFFHYRHDSTRASSLCHNEVTALAQDSTGDLWIGTVAGLDRLASPGAGRFAHFKHNPHDPQSLSSDRISSLLTDRTGTLWIGTEKGLNALPNGGNGAFVRYALADSIINTIYEDSRGRLWIGSPSGLYRRDGMSGAPVFTHLPFTFDRVGIDWQWSICAIHELPDGKLWLGTFANLLLFDPRTGLYQAVRHNPRDPNSPGFDAVISIFQDNGGVMWLGTSGKGVDRLDLFAKPFHFYSGRQLPDEMGEFSVRAVLKDRSGMLWISANNRLYQLNRATNEWRHIKEIAYPVGGIGQDEQGVLWFSAWHGYFSYDPRSRSFSPIQPEPCSRNDLRISSAAGQRSRMDFIPGLASYHLFQNLNDFPVFCIYRDARGIAWLATKSGLIRFDPQTTSHIIYRNDPKNPDGLSYDVVFSILPDPLEPNRILWLGTAGGGLDRFDTVTGKFTHYTETDGLPNNVIYGILPDRHGRLWMSTNRGLSVFDPQAKTFRNFDASDGLQSNEFNRGAYFMSDDGEMFFGGINGLNAFFPDSIRDKSHVPPVVITDFQLAYESVSWRQPNSPLHQPISETTELHLAHNQNTMTFEFAALDYAEPGKNHYAYMMENFDSQWIQARATRRATYTNLPPGHYIFRVKGANNDGVWNETGAAIRITIRTPLWERWWAFALYVVLASSAVIGFIKFRLRRLKKRTQELEIAVQQRTAEVVEREKQLAVQAEKLRELDRIKSSFFANISHEFRTPLTLILGPVEQLIGRTTAEDVKRELSRIQKSAQRLLRLVNQLLDLSKLESGKMVVNLGVGNIVPLLRSITMSFASLAEQKQIALSFETAAEDIRLGFDRDKIEKIFYNLLTNAFKFTPAGGSIKMSVREHDDGAGNAPATARETSFPQAAVAGEKSNFLAITVADTGIGISADRLPLIFDRFYQADASNTREHEGTGIGLSLVKELVSLHHGNVQVNSVVGEGSRFTVFLPLEKEASIKDEPLKQLDSPGAAAESETAKAWLTAETFIAETAVESADSAENQADAETIVLVVEDHADVRAYIRDYLKADYTVIEAGDGAEGLEKAREHIPDLVIGDVMMPRLDGYGLCRALKADERTSHIPVILLTARAALEDRVAGLKTGADDYLIKPFNAIELQTRVANLIESRRKLRECWQRTVMLRPNEIAATPIDQLFLEKALAVVEASLDDESFGAGEFAERLGLSRSQLHRKLRALINQSASQFLRSVRLMRAAELLRAHAGNVAEITYRVGFANQAYFARCFQEQFGCSPKEYGKGEG